jgi:hypothetical protein
MNQNTAYIDASMVYGTTHLEANVKLRVHERGYVRSRLNEDGRWMLAISPDANDGCNRPEFMTKNRFCFKSGTHSFRPFKCTGRVCSISSDNCFKTKCNLKLLYTNQFKLLMTSFDYL